MATLNDLIRAGIKTEDLVGATPELQRVLEPLLRYVNLGLQGIAQALAKNVSLSENVRNEIRTVNLDHAVPQPVSLKRLSQAKGVRSLSVGSADGKTQHALAMPLQIQGTTTPNQVKLTGYFLDTTARRVPVTVELLPEGSYTSLTPSDGAWTAPALLNSWVQHSASESTVGFMKDAYGIVHLRGSLQGGVPGPASTIFTMPAGYRPSKGMFFPVMSNAAFGFAAVDTTGNVIAYQGSGVTYYLDGITFDTRT